MKKALLCVLGLSMLTACADPTSVTRTAESRPSIIVRDAPMGATFSVDGINIGEVKSDEAVLVEPGKHVIKVYSGSGTPIHTETVFVSGSVLREIKLPSSVQKRMF